MGRSRRSRFLNRAAGALAVALALVGWLVSAAERWPANAQQTVATEAQPRSRSDAFSTTLDYVVEFYPLWFTYYQSLIGTHNRLVGPERITPVYQTVVAINDDTLYASSFLDLDGEPLILKIPPTPATYSILTLDPFGTIFDSGISAGTPGTYALTGPGFSGNLPAGVTRISIPLDVSVLIFRVDKFSSAGKNLKKEADAFRRSLTTQTLSDYKAGEPATATLILPVEAFSVPFKTIADREIARRPIAFLRQLQQAVEADNTPPLSARQQRLSDRFDKLFGDGTFRSAERELEFSAGARAAHDLIVSRYLKHRGPTNWIHFTNIGEWGRHVVERAAISEFIQYGNNISAAAYYHAFLDNRGRPLDGSKARGYVLTIPKSKLPKAKRFWSFTAYTPNSIELVRNEARKYVVASYTPGLRYNGDGSLSIYMTREVPKGVPEANWLPVPDGPFNIMLRVYGPEGKVANNTYVPPSIRKR